MTRSILLVCMAVGVGCLPDTDGFDVVDAGADAMDADGSLDGGPDGAPDSAVDASLETGEDASSDAATDGADAGMDASAPDGAPDAAECTGTGPCDDSDPCTTGETCSAGLCGGGDVTPCPPPAPRCSGANTRVTFAGGRCERPGGCAFDEDRTECEFGCMGGECLDEMCDAMDWSLAVVPADVGFASKMDHVADADGGDHVVFIADGDGSVHYIQRMAGGTGWFDSVVEVPAVGRDKDPAIALDSEGRPQIVFSRWDDELIHAEVLAGSWVTTTIDDDGVSAGIVATSTDELHVVFARAGGMRHARRASAATLWTVDLMRRARDGVTRTLTGEAPTLLIDADDTVHMAFIDFFSDTLDYGRYEEGVWEYELIYDGMVHPSSFDTALDAAGGLHVSFANESTNDIRYGFRPRGVGTWSLALVHDAVNRLGENAIGVSPTGAVHIAYRHETNRDLLYATRAAGGGFFTSDDLIDLDNGFPAGVFADDSGRVRVLYRAVPPIGSSDEFRLARMRTCAD